MAKRIAIGDELFIVKIHLTQGKIPSRVRCRANRNGQRIRQSHTVQRRFQMTYRALIPPKSTRNLAFRIKSERIL
jgi:hypothetical protein